MIGKKLPAYWEEYLQEKINKVRAWKKLAGEGGFCVDFTGKGGNVAAWLGGHIHRDESGMENGVLCIDTTTDAAFAGRHSQKKGTINEQAFDVFVFDSKQRKCNAVRFGAGEDREFSY